MSDKPATRANSIFRLMNSPTFGLGAPIAGVCRKKNHGSRDGRMRMHERDRARTDSHEDQRMEFADLKHLATVLWSLGTVGWRGAIP